MAGNANRGVIAQLVAHQAGEAELIGLVGDGNDQVFAAHLREDRVHAISALEPLWIVVEIGLGERTVQGRADKARIHRRIMLTRLQRLLLIEIPLDLSRIIAALKALALALRLCFGVHLLIDRSDAAREVLLKLSTAGIVRPVVAAGEHATGAVSEDPPQNSRPTCLSCGLISTVRRTALEGRLAGQHRAPLVDREISIHRQEGGKLRTALVNPITVLIWGDLS